jgi:uncharacterized protein DUF2336
MTAPLLFPGFDGLMTLSRREGVDIRPTLLRVLTDLYVQASVHSDEEERQFVELTSRLIEQVDDATRAAVRARLAIYPGTPAEVLKRLGLRRTATNQIVELTPEVAAPPPAPPPRPPSEAQARLSSNLMMQPKDAAEITDLFFGAGPHERALILHNLVETPLKASARIPAARAARAIQTLEMAAFAEDVENFTRELGEALILPWRVATQVVNDAGGEPLACAVKALDMPGPVFERVLLFLNPELGSSVAHVYRLSRLYDGLHERAALIMLAAWRGATMAVARAKFRPGLYDDERNRARAASGQARPAVHPGSDINVRTGSQKSGR